MNGYLDFFEPDFLVEAEQGLGKGLGFDPKRVLHLTNVLEVDSQRERNGCGLSVLDLYRDLYRKEFQFEHRHARNIVHVKAGDKAYAAFVACNFGAFPVQEGLEYFERGYIDVFTPLQETLDGATLFKLYNSRYTCALDIGHARLKVDYHAHSEPTLFIADAREYKDLIDFWNLRAVYGDIRIIPIQWVEALSPFCRKFILTNHRPLPGNPHGVMIQPVSLFSRSIPPNDIETIHAQYLHVDKKGANGIQTWYPPIWRPAPEIMVRTTRPTLEAETKRIDVPIDLDKRELRFDPLFPEFAADYGNTYRWANVVRLKDWSGGHLTATVFPCNFRNPRFPMYGIGRDHLLP